MVGIGEVQSSRDNMDRVKLRRKKQRTLEMLMYERLFLILHVESKLTYPTASEKTEADTYTSKRRGGQKGLHDQRDP